MLEVNVDNDGKASGVTYLKRGRSFFQPAKVVILSSYIYENTRLMLLSTSKAYPHGLSNNHGQVGQNYMGHGLASASVMGVFKGQKLNLYSGTIGQYTAIDDWDADNFDHTGLGFISGGMVSATMQSKPINGTANTIPPTVPTWGSAYKAWLAENYDSVGTISARSRPSPTPRTTATSTRSSRTTSGGRCFASRSLQENEIKAASGCRARSRHGSRRLMRADIWTFPPSILAEHARGTARMGTDPDTSVLDEWHISHEVQNLLVLGGAAFPTTTGRNPTESIQATSWRAGDHLKPAVWPQPQYPGCVRNVLLTNDDGIEADGLQTLRRALVALDDVRRRRRRARRQPLGDGALDHDAPAAVGRPRSTFDDGSVGYATDGTPVDCVRLAEPRADRAASGPTSSSPASTTAPTSATTSPTRAPSPRRSRGSCSASRRSPSRSSRARGELDYAPTARYDFDVRRRLRRPPGRRARATRRCRRRR